MNVHFKAGALQIEERLNTVFDSQRAAFFAQPYPDINTRRKNLINLKTQVIRYQDVLAEAMSKDFGHRSVSESKMLDMLGSALGINHVLSNLKIWMKPSRRATELLFLSNSLKVTYQPKGVVGVIVPWNFPLYLAVGPLTTALAAGNRVMIKMPEITPATNAVFKRLIAEVFDESEVAVFGEEVLDPNKFTSLPFDHLVYTGSSNIGKVVMATAAKNLTPVTLELGGKSPAIVLPDASVATAARRIAHGKSTNCGQVCVAPDYALVPRAKLDEFVTEAAKSYRAMFTSRVDNNDDHTNIVSDHHASRLGAILEDAKSKGAKVYSCAEYGNPRQLSMQIVTNVNPGMRVMQEEIFGPILPVIPYDSLEDAIQYINAGQRPLALYMFGHSQNTLDEVLSRTHSGGVTINDWGWHVMNHGVPFGGIGNSGMGTYHGIEGFRELSHAKSVFHEHRFFPITLFHPPYGNLVQRLVMRVFLGKGDESLRLINTQNNSNPQQQKQG